MDGSGVWGNTKICEKRCPLHNRGLVAIVATFPRIRSDAARTKVTVVRDILSILPLHAMPAGVHRRQPAVGREGRLLEEHVRVHHHGTLGAPERLGAAEREGQAGVSDLWLPVQLLQSLIMQLCHLPSRTPSSDLCCWQAAVWLAYSCSVQGHGGCRRGYERGLVSLVIERPPCASILIGDRVGAAPGSGGAQWLRGAGYGTIRTHIRYNARKAVCMTMANHTAA